MKNPWKYVLAILFVPVFFIGYFLGRHNMADSGELISSCSAPAAEDSTLKFHPLTVDDIGVDSIRFSYLTNDGINAIGKITPNKSEMIVEIDIYSDSTVCISDYDRSVILRSIDCLYISKTSRPIKKIVNLDIEYSWDNPSLGVTIYKDGEDYYNEIYPASLIGSNKGYIFSNPAYDLICTITAIGKEVKHPNDGKINRNFGDPRKELMETLVKDYYPNTVALETRKQF